MRRSGGAPITCSLIYCCWPVPSWQDRHVLIAEGRETVQILRGDGVPAPAGERASLDLAGAPSDLLSLLPIGGNAEGVSTDGLVYPLHDETLFFSHARGVSNEFSATTARASGCAPGCYSSSTRASARIERPLRLPAWARVRPQGMSARMRRKSAAQDAPAGPNLPEVKNMNRYFTWIAVIILALSLAACGRRATPTPAPTVPAAPTAAPSATESPAQAAPRRRPQPPSRSPSRG